MAIFADEATNLRADDPRCSARRCDRQPRVRGAERRVPAHARVRPRDPARRPRDRRRRSTPRSRGSRQTRALLGRPSCRAWPASSARPRATSPRHRRGDRRCSRRTTSSPSAWTASSCRPATSRSTTARSTTDAENYKEFWYTMVGLAGEGQNFDGNGQYVRFQTGGGDQTVSTGTTVGGTTDRLFGNAVRADRHAPASSRASARRTGPTSPCYTQALPDLNGAATGAPDRRRVAPAQRRRAAAAAGARRRGRRPPVGAGRARDEDRAIRKHSRDFVAIIVARRWSRSASAATSSSNQRFYLPHVGAGRRRDFVELKAESPTAQSVTPGQGQTVDDRGRRRRRDHEGRPRRRPRRRDDEDPAQVHADLQGRDRCCCARRRA